MANMGSIAAGSPAMESMTGNSPAEVAGANRFSNLKGLFKQQYSTCKHCGKPFVPKISHGNEKQKIAAAINAAKKGPRI